MQQRSDYGFKNYSKKEHKCEYKDRNDYNDNESKAVEDGREEVEEIEEVFAGF